MAWAWGGGGSHLKELAVSPFKLRASLLILVLLLGMLAVSAGDLVASSERALAYDPLGLNGGGIPDSLYGGGNDPDSDTGDPDDCDLTIPLTLWFINHLF
jgi:hypothetical protein